jgi:hypothetical protein
MTCSTIVENPLQIGPFLQNKANLRKGRTSVNTYSKKGYENLGIWRLGKNKANQSQFEAKANVKMGKTYQRTKTPDGGIGPPFPRWDRGG